MIILDDEDTQPMDFADLWKEYAAEVKPKCTCGTTITYGPVYPIDKHSEWCDLRQRKTTDRWYDI
jgi:hypothetical protein